MRRYRVTGYSEGLWCIVDSTRFLDERARAANWPMQVWWHEALGWIWPLASNREAHRIANQLNEFAEHSATP